MKIANLAYTLELGSKITNLPNFVPKLQNLQNL